ncbi:hypothetical protein BKA69DRAFT_1126748 [Paraphysoderma sedebokerense]|nr:hypothetical protein BKA69DRAFT_1126748 [Paraphysoderma sedebokerense]
MDYIYNHSIPCSRKVTFPFPYKRLRNRVQKKRPAPDSKFNRTSCPKSLYSFAGVSSDRIKSSAKSASRNGGIQKRQRNNVGFKKFKSSFARSSSPSYSPSSHDCKSYHYGRLSYLHSRAFKDLMLETMLLENQFIQQMKVFEEMQAQELDRYRREVVDRRDIQIETSENSKAIEFASDELSDDDDEIEIQLDLSTNSLSPIPSSSSSLSTSSVEPHTDRTQSYSLMDSVADDDLVRLLEHKTRSLGIEDYTDVREYQNSLADESLHSSASEQKCGDSALQFSEDPYGWGELF